MVQRVHSADNRNHHDSWMWVLWSTDCLASMAKNVCAIISIITDRRKGTRSKAGLCVFRCPRCCGPSWTWCWWGSRRREPRPRSSFSTPSSSCLDPLPASSPSWDTIATADPCWPKDLPSSTLKKKKNHTHNTHHQGGTALTQPKHPTARWRATDTHTCNREVD